MVNRTPMVVIGIILIVFALLIAIIPQFSSCQSQGMQITLQNGKTIPMKCYWSGQSEVIVGILLLITGIMMLVSKRKESSLLLSVFGIALGIAVIILPAYVIGVCEAPTHICNTVMKISLLVLGAFTLVASILGLIMAVRTKENGQ